MAPSSHAARTVTFVSCVATKLSEPAPARDLYTSPWFRKARLYAERSAAPWFVLSAAYGLVSPDQVISPYDETLNHMPVVSRRRWSESVLAALAVTAPAMEVAILLAGRRYREFLQGGLENRSVEVDVPMRGMGIGKQLAWLSMRC